MQSQETDLSMEKTNALRKMSGEEELSLEDIAGVIIKDVKSKNQRIALDRKKLRSYFPKDVPEDEMWNVIYDLLERWSHSDLKEE